MLLVNFTGPPSAGKSTLAAGVFRELKALSMDVELVIEYTKELHRRQDYWTLSDELLVFSEKYRRIKQFENVDVVVTDSPLYCSLFYGQNQFDNHGVDLFKHIADTKFESIFFVLPGRDNYDPRGRTPDQQYAQEAGDAITNFIRQSPWPVWDVPVDSQEQFVVSRVLETIEGKI
jgi:hypothetical protein